MVRVGACPEGYWKCTQQAALSNSKKKRKRKEKLVSLAHEGTQSYSKKNDLKDYYGNPWLLAENIKLHVGRLRKTANS